MPAEWPGAIPTLSLSAGLVQGMWAGKRCGVGIILLPVVMDKGLGKTATRIQVPGNGLTGWNR